MRTRVCIVIELVLVSLFCWQLPVEAADSLNYLKRLLRGSAEAELLPDNSAEGDAIVRVAQRPAVASVLARKSKESPAAIDAVDKATKDRPAEQETTRADAAINRQFDTLQRQLEREEASLESRLNALNKRRDAALTKNDEKQLARIQAMEAAAVAEYEKRVERILASATTKPQTPLVASTRSPRVGAENIRQKDPRSVRPEKPVQVQQPKSPQRRRRLWPFFKSSEGLFGIGGK